MLVFCVLLGIFMWLMISISVGRNIFFITIGEEDYLMISFQRSGVAYAQTREKR